VRRVANGVIATIAGVPNVCVFSGNGVQATAATFKVVYGLAHFDGVLYVVDGLTNVIRGVALSSGIISTYAGTASSTYSPTNPLDYPWYVTFDSHGNLYVGGFGTDGTIRRIERTTRAISVIAGNNIVGYSGDGGYATAAQLKHPLSVAFDPAGNMYIADYGKSTSYLDCCASN
jgi:hypothetical protein